MASAAGTKTEKGKYQPKPIPEGKSQPGKRRPHSENFENVSRFYTCMHFSTPTPSKDSSRTWASGAGCCNYLSLMQSEWKIFHLLGAVLYRLPGGKVRKSLCSHFHKQNPTDLLTRREKKANHPKLPFISQMNNESIFFFLPFAQQWLGEWDQLWDKSHMCYYRAELNWWGRNWSNRGICRFLFLFSFQLDCDGLPPEVSFFSSFVSYFCVISGMSYVDNRMDKLDEWCQRNLHTEIARKLAQFSLEFTGLMLMMRILYCEITMLMKFQVLSMVFFMATYVLRFA